MGACSGCLANGSEESHVFTLVPSGPLKSASQVPERSGIPPDIRPGCRGFASAEPGAVCAGKLEEDASAATIAAIKTASRIRIFAFLRADRLTHSDRPGSAWPLTTTLRMNVIVLEIPTGAPFREG